MVEKETIELDTAALQMLVVGGQAKRGLNGEWAVVIKLDGDIGLGDGRTLPVRREVHVKARQQGRKANPAQNWGKGGGFRKKK
jgi:hypothetical protein